MSGVIRQQDWDESDLRRAGFEKYGRRKQIVMARVLPPAEAPKTIITAWGDKLIAQAGYYICYDPLDTRQDSIEAYDQWPVEADIFQQTYKKWDEAFQPSPSHAHLIEKGCKPYYKAEGVWAKQTDSDIYIQSMEHEKPVLIPTGRMIAIGKEGEPYSMGEETFSQRYQSEKVSIVKRILKRLGIG